MGILVTALMLSAPHSAASTRPLVLPAAESTADQRGRYPQALLERALAKANYPVTVSAFAAPASQERLLRLLELRRVDVIWSMASVERAERLRMVPFPIDRGLLGWRALLATEVGALSDASDAMHRRLYEDTAAMSALTREIADRKDQLEAVVQQHTAELEEKNLLLAEQAKTLQGLVNVDALTGAMN